MGSHTAKGLFEKNINSAKHCLELYDRISKLKPGGINLKWILRAAVVFAVSALDTYFHDKIKYSVGKLSIGNLPPSLEKLEIPISELTSWEKARRKGNVLRNWVVNHLSTRSLQSPQMVADGMKLIGIQGIWAGIEPDKHARKKLIAKLNSLIWRRNQISHGGDRMTSRRSGKMLRPIGRKQVAEWIAFVESLVNKVESAFPR